MAQDDLIEFYGTECVHCRKMEPLIQRLQDEAGIKVVRLEVWHNEENAKLMMQLDKDYCGGIPFFFNKKSGKWICGNTDYETLRKWAQGQ
jgi:thiol-disulfide isomerase/thioredoxin